jgi:hypothetical protein
LPVTITEVWTEKVLADGRKVRQTKFDVEDTFSVVVNFTVSPDLGKSKFRYIFRIFWETFNQSQRNVLAWLGHETSAQLPQNATEWQVSLEHRNWFAHQSGYHMLKGVLLIDIIGVDEVPVISKEFVIAVGEDT